MNNISNCILQLLDEIRASKRTAAIINAGYSDEFVTQIINYNLKIKTTKDFEDDVKIPLKEITGIDKAALPLPDDLLNKQKEDLAIELNDLLNMHHLYPLFPAHLPDHLKYEGIRNLWHNRYPIVKKDACYIEICDYTLNRCPFKGYCTICNEIELEGRINSFIRRIEIFCDRWCLKCIAKNHCYYYGQCSFYELRREVIEIRDLQRHIAGKAEPLTEEDAVVIKANHNIEKYDSEFEEHAEMIEEHIIHVASLYGSRCHKWLKDKGAFFESKQLLWETQACLEKNREALYIISWYCLLISKTLNRAFWFLDKISIVTIWSKNLINVKNFYFNGMVKLAIIAIDRSIIAWEEIQPTIPEFDADIQFFTDLLGDLCMQIDDYFPGARDFIRPGLDEC